MRINNIKLLFQAYYQFQKQDQTSAMPPLTLSNPLPPSTYLYLKTVISKHLAAHRCYCQHINKQFFACGVVLANGLLFKLTRQNVS